jgi:hypothetical protein
MKRLLLGGLVLALVAGCGSDGGAPVTLPVLAGGRPEASAVAGDTRLAAPTRYRFAGDLPALDDQAPAYTLEPGRAGGDEVDHLAEVLGTRTGLDVQRAAGRPWSFSRAQADTSVASCAADGPCEEPRRPEGLPAKAEATKLGQEILGRLGVDLDHATVRVDDGFSTWNVAADPEIDGLPVVGMSTSVAIGVDGRIEYANGWLGEPDKGDDYPLIGAQSALKKLQEQQVTTMMMPVCEDTAPCPAPDPITVEVTDVRIGLQLFSYGEPDEPGYLVPSYLFATRDGGELPVVAVEDRYLAPPEAPKGKPVPEPHPNTEQCVGAGADGLAIEACGPNSPALDQPATFRITAKAECAPRVVVHWNDGTPDATMTPDPAEEVAHTYRKADATAVDLDVYACGADEPTLSTSLPVAIGEDDPPMTIEPQPAPGGTGSAQVQGTPVDGKGGSGHER